jgi:hypothetical protein
MVMMSGFSSAAARNACVLATTSFSTRTLSRVISGRLGRKQADDRSAAEEDPSDQGGDHAERYQDSERPPPFAAARCRCPPAAPMAGFGNRLNGQ